MDRSRYSTEELVSRWEYRREIKNLMGKYINCLALNRESEVFDLFWLQTENGISLAFNDGVYRGTAAVRGFYDALHRRGLLASALIRRRLPELCADDKGRELGTFRVRSISSPVIEVAGDGLSAKGLWCCLGSCAEVTESGPVSYWISGYYAVDFVRTESGWRIWHMQSLNDICRPSGQDWSRAAAAFPPLPEFSGLSGFSMPEYTLRAEFRRTYSPDRELTPPPRTPEPYEHFDETFSYGL